MTAHQVKTTIRRSNKPLTRFLGWFSIGLGLAEVVSPRALGKLIGVEAKTGFTRIQGMREIGAGVGILMNHRPTNWVRARVAGDALDLGTLARCYTSPEANLTRLSIATAAVVGVTALDVICARRLAELDLEADRASHQRNLAAA